MQKNLLVNDRWLMFSIVGLFIFAFIRIISISAESMFSQPVIDWVSIIGVGVAVFLLSKRYSEKLLTSQSPLVWWSVSALIILYCLLFDSSFEHRMIVIGELKVSAYSVIIFCYLYGLASFLASPHLDNQYSKPNLIVLFFFCLVMSLSFIQPNGNQFILVILMTNVLCMVSARPNLKAYVLGITLAVATLLCVLLVTSEYRFTRLMNIFHPWDDAYSGGFQLSVSLSKIGGGDWFGSTATTLISHTPHSMTEASNVMMMSSMTEQFGVVAALTLLMCSMIFILRLIKYVLAFNQSHRKFECYFTAGVATYFFYQVAGHTAGNIGLYAIGLSFPIVASELSANLVFVMMVGLVLSFSRPEQSVETKSLIKASLMPILIIVTLGGILTNYAVKNSFFDKEYEKSIQQKLAP